MSRSVSLYANGSVRFIKEKCPVALFQSLGNRAAGEVVSADSHRS